MKQYVGQSRAKSYGVKYTKERKRSRSRTPPKNSPSKDFIPILIPAKQSLSVERAP